MILAGGLANAQIAPTADKAAVQSLPVERTWKQRTERDVEAAYRLLKDNHPAASVDTHDPAFVERLNKAHTIAARRAALVTSLDGYNATLRGFAYSMGDGHIWSHPKSEESDIYWAGIIVAKRAADWVVVREDLSLVGNNIVGSTLVSCDHKPTAKFAEQVLSFRAVAGDAAMETMRAARLLMDDGNPFIKRPSVCRFQMKGHTSPLTLNWQKANIDQLQKAYWKPVPGNAGFGVRAIGGGYWVSMEALDPKAQLVIDKVAENSSAIRKSRYVVVDLRGNFGGNDLYGRKLADTLYGPNYVRSRLGPISGGCPPIFRASPDNIAATKVYIKDFEKSGDVDGAAEYKKALQAMEAARKNGMELTGGITCQSNLSRYEDATSSLIDSPVIVLTDVGCFSSCINTVGYLIRLGAIQVGQMTGSDTHYSEVREISLPSQLSTFSTMMALMPDAPAHIGPFIPTVPYAGDISDTEALETWIPAHALREISEASHHPAPAF
jgi:hypothetical protein